jgi:hypothetical protein
MLLEENKIQEDERVNVKIILTSRSQEVLDAPNPCAEVKLTSFRYLTYSFHFRILVSHFVSYSGYHPAFYSVLKTRLASSSDNMDEMYSESTLLESCLKILSALFKMRTETGS